MTRAYGVVALLVMVGSTVGCGSKEPQSREKKKAPDQADSVRRLPEGTETAFGLKLPAGSIIVRQGADAMDVQVPAPADEVLTFLRARLDAKSVDVGPRRTVFRFAKLVDGPAGRLDVTVTRMPTLTKLNIAVHSDPALEPSSPRAVRPKPPTPSFTSTPAPTDDED